MLNWPCGATVSTLDSESSDRGSNPREALSLVMICIGLIGRLHLLMAKGREGDGGKGGSKNCRVDGWVGGYGGVSG